MNLYSTESHGAEVTQRYRREAETARQLADAPRRPSRAAGLMTTIAALVRRWTRPAERPHDPRPAHDGRQRTA
jgi:hypothetical protein